jgi:hypothetical protein
MVPWLSPHCGLRKPTVWAKSWNHPTVFKAFSPTPNSGGVSKLLVCHENDTWDERILQNLEDEGIGLEPLEVYIARIAHLAALSDATFRALGANEVIEDVN